MEKIPWQRLLRLRKHKSKWRVFFFGFSVGLLLIVLFSYNSIMSCIHPNRRQIPNALNRKAPVPESELREMLIADPKLFATMHRSMVNRGLAAEVARVHQERGTWEAAGLPPPLNLASATAKGQAQAQAGGVTPASGTASAAAPKS